MDTKNVAVKSSTISQHAELNTKLHSSLRIAVPAMIAGLFIVLPLLVMGVQQIPWMFAVDPIRKFFAALAGPVGFVAYWLVAFLITIISIVMINVLEDYEKLRSNHIKNLEKVAYCLGLLALILILVGSFGGASAVSMLQFANISTFFGIQVGVAIGVSMLLKIVGFFSMLLVASGGLVPNHWLK